jgi:hypothetical protein
VFGQAACFQKLNTSILSYPNKIMSDMLRQTIIRLAPSFLPGFSSGYGWITSRPITKSLGRTRRITSNELPSEQFSKRSPSSTKPFLPRQALTPVGDAGLYIARDISHKNPIARLPRKQLSHKSRMPPV